MVQYVLSELSSSSVIHPHVSNVGHGLAAALPALALFARGKSRSGDKFMRIAQQQDRRRRIDQPLDLPRFFERRCKYFLDDFTRRRAQQVNAGPADRREPLQCGAWALGFVTMKLPGGIHGIAGPAHHLHRFIELDDCRKDDRNNTFGFGPLRGLGRRPGEVAQLEP